MKQRIAEGKVRTKGERMGMRYYSALVHPARGEERPSPDSVYEGRSTAGRYASGQRPARKMLMPRNRTFIRKPYSMIRPQSAW